MNLEQFRASRYWSDDLGRTLNDEWQDGFAGYAYAGDLAIAAESPTGPFTLSIGNHVEMSDDLATLERDLWEWARDDGYWGEA